MVSFDALDLSRNYLIVDTTVADPGFPRRLEQSLNLGKNLLFGKMFAENSMGMKEMGPRWGRLVFLVPPECANALAPKLVLMLMLNHGGTLQLKSMYFLQTSMRVSTLALTLMLGVNKPLQIKTHLQLQLEDNTKK